MSPTGEIEVWPPDKIVVVEVVSPAELLVFLAGRLSEP